MADHELANYYSVDGTNGCIFWWPHGIMATWPQGFGFESQLAHVRIPNFVLILIVSRIFYVNNIHWLYPGIKKASFDLTKCTTFINNSCKHTSQLSSEPVFQQSDPLIERGNKQRYLRSFIRLPRNEGNQTVTRGTILQLRCSLRNAEFKVIEKFCDQRLHFHNAIKQ